MAFHLVLELDDLPPFNNTAFKKLCDQYLITRLIVAAARAGATEISIVGAPEVLAAARQELAGDRRLATLNLHWGEPAAVDLPVVRGPAATAIGNTAWAELAKAQEPVFLPGAPQWRKYPDAETHIPLWPEAQWVPGRFAIPIRTEADLKRAKQEIFASITKATSGPVSRYLNARLSIPLSKLLVETPITPNQMTIANTVIGVISALCFAVGTLPAVALGGLIFQLSSALDRNDGELARAKLMESERGAWIDTIGDNITYLAFMVCLVIGYARYSVAQQLAWSAWVMPAGLGLIVVATGLIVWMLWYVRRQGLGGSVTAISRQFEATLDSRRAGWAYRLLSRFRVLGERDQFSLAIMFFAVMPVLTGNDAWYHALFFGTIAAIVAMSIYFLSAAAKLRAVRRQGASSLQA